MAGQWDESKHPRDGGKFASSGGGGGSGATGRGSAIAKAAIGAKRSGKKKDIDKAYQHVVAGSQAKDRGETHKEFAKASALFTKHGEAPNSEAQRLFAKHGYEHAPGNAATSASAKQNDQAGDKSAKPSTGGLDWKVQTHYMSGYGGDGRPVYAQHPGHTEVSHADHGQYMVSNDPRMDGGGWHEAVYFPKERKGRSGDVQFIDSHGRPNAPTMGAYRTKDEAQAAIAKHHNNVTKGIPDGMVRLR